MHDCIPLYTRKSHTAGVRGHATCTSQGSPIGRIRIAAQGDGYTLAVSVHGIFCSVYLSISALKMILVMRLYPSCPHEQSLWGSTVLLDPWSSVRVAMPVIRSSGPFRTI